MILHASEIGGGPPVALLHGLFGRSQNLGSVARGLAGACRVVSLDLRNHGASPHAAGMDYRTLATDIMETLAKREALPAALVGHSMGGKAAMAAALMHPDQVSRLLVADIAPVAYVHDNARIATAMQALQMRPGLTRAAADAMLATDIPDPAIRSFLLQNLQPGEAPGWRISLRDIAAGLPDIEGFPAWPAGTTYDGPALFLRGAQSDYVGEAHRGTILSMFPAAVVATLETAGHWLHADQPAAFLSATAAFLEGSVPGRGPSG